LLPRGRGRAVGWKKGWLSTDSGGTRGAGARGLNIVLAAAQEVVMYTCTDALVSTVAITAVNGNVIERTVYEPSGELVQMAMAEGARGERLSQVEWEHVVVKQSLTRY